MLFRRHWVFSCAMLSGVSSATLHRVFGCATLHRVFVPRVLRHYWTGFFHVKCFLEALGQHCTMLLLVQCCPKSIKATLNRILFYAMLSRANWTTLHKVLTCACNVVPIVLRQRWTCAILSWTNWRTLYNVFTCAMLSQEYYDFIEQEFFMCNVFWRPLDNIAQDFYLCNVLPRVLRQHWTGFFPV